MICCAGVVLLYQRQPCGGGVKQVLTSALQLHQPTGGARLTALVALVAASKLGQRGMVNGAGGVHSAGVPQRLQGSQLVAGGGGVAPRLASPHGNQRRSLGRGRHHNGAAGGGGRRGRGGNRGRLRGGGRGRAGIGGAGGGRGRAGGRLRLAALALGAAALALGAAAAAAAGGGGGGGGHSGKPLW